MSEQVGMGTFEQIKKNNPDKIYLSVTGLDAGVIGVTDDDRLIYSIAKTIQALMDTQDWDYEMAQEWFWRNTECAYMGPKTPKFTDEFDEFFEEE